MSRIPESSCSKKYDIHFIRRGVFYTLLNLGFKGFLYYFNWYCVDEDIDNLLEKIKKSISFLYHPLLIEDEKSSSKEKFCLLFFFKETTSPDIISGTLDCLKGLDGVKFFEEYIDEEFIEYNKILISCINGTYEETRLEEYKKILRNGREITNFYNISEQLKEGICDFFKEKRQAKFAEMLKVKNLLKEKGGGLYNPKKDYPFKKELTILQRENFVHYIYSPLDPLVFENDDSENEYTYEKTMSTLKRIDKKSILGKIVPYKAEVLYVDIDKNNIYSQIECGFEIDDELLIRQFVIYEYAYDEKSVKFYKSRFLNKMESPLDSYTEKYIYNQFILIMIMKLANAAREYGLVMKKFKGYSYEYTFLFNVHSDMKVYLCKKPIRIRRNKNESANQFFEDFQNSENAYRELMLKKEYVLEQNKKHEKEWEKAKKDYEFEKKRIEQERRERINKSYIGSSSYGNTGYNWSCWTPFFNISDYDEYLEGKKIDGVYRTIERYQSKRK